jgi:hypothetical protein
MLTLFSNRVYKNTFPAVEVFAVGEEIVNFNSAKYHLVNGITHSERTGQGFLAEGQSLHMYAKGTFGYNDYFANSVIIAAKKQRSTATKRTGGIVSVSGRVQ